VLGIGKVRLNKPKKSIGNEGRLRRFMNRMNLSKKKTDMNTQFIVTESGVPAGPYSATFQGLDPFEENLDKYGEGCILRFVISSGDFKGKEASRIVSKRFSPKSNLYRFAKALIGRDLQSGESFDFADFVGTKGMVVIEATDSGATRVATFLKAAE
jgi:hypothetical protein